MSNPPRQKGTKEETAIVNEWNGLLSYGATARRMPASSVYDIHVEGFEPAIEVLATRADRGERLVTLRFKDFVRLWGLANDDVLDAPELHIEAKRYARFAVNTLFASKFGKKP